MSSSSSSAGIHFPCKRSPVEDRRAAGRGQPPISRTTRTIELPLGLHFIPVLRERFDLVVRRRCCFGPPFQRVLKLCRTSAVARKGMELGGYDLSDQFAFHFNSPSHPQAPHKRIVQNGRAVRVLICGCRFGRA
jgi:hypothetical protein